MSNRRKAKPNPTKTALNQLCNVQLPGGCDDCGAYQRMTLTAGIYRVSVYHDPGCPFHAGVTR